jgi:hypothetical protein
MQRCSDSIGALAAALAKAQAEIHWRPQLCDDAEPKPAN